MKEKSPIEKNAERKQIDLLSEALNGASNANGYWLNASGKGYPKFHPRGVSVSPFNALFMALHSDKNGCGSNLFIHYRWVLSIPFFISCIRQQNPLTVLSKIILRKVKQFNLPPPKKK